MVYEWFKCYRCSIEKTSDTCAHIVTEAPFTSYRAKPRKAKPTDHDKAATGSGEAAQVPRVRQVALPFPARQCWHCKIELRGVKVGCSRL